MRSEDLTQSALTEKSIGRFLAKVERKSQRNECWLWTGAKSPAGYGKVRRVAYAIEHGRDPGGEQVQIACGNRLCCNPFHLTTAVDLSEAKTRKKKRASKPKRPRPDFPLSAHTGSNQWTKRIRGRLFYFGPLRDPDAALARYLEEKDELRLGRTPNSRSSDLTVRVLVNQFLTDRKPLVDSGELSQRTWNDYHSMGATLIERLGRDKHVEDISQEDLAVYRSALALRLEKAATSTTLPRIVMAPWVGARGLPSPGREILVPERGRYPFSKCADPRTLYQFE